MQGESSSSDVEIPSSRTNSPPDTHFRYSKIEDKLETLFEDEELDLPKVQKHINRTISSGKQALQDLTLANSTIKKIQNHKSPTPKSRRIIKGASKSPLSSIQGNSKIRRRCTDESRVDIRFDMRTARVSDYWRRANQALKEKEEVLGGKDYIDTDSELFSIVNRDGMVDDK